MFRREDILKLKLPMFFGRIEVQDLMRFFIGDHPELAFEAGNSIGGHYPCTCGCLSEKFGNFQAMCECKPLTLEERRQKIVAGPAGRRHNAINPFESLTPEVVLKECMLRGIYTAESKEKPTKKNLEPILKNHLKGAVRPPARWNP
eukprot:TCONS_00032984-protein